MFITFLRMKASPQHSTGKMGVTISLNTLISVPAPGGTGNFWHVGLPKHTSNWLLLSGNSLAF
ncbi:hypothetical protein C2129_23550 [Escherichia coli]|nr:hypothetical protein C2129_23550 [Escherichia coli]